jgi:hypothetical protein
MRYTEMLSLRPVTRARAVALKGTPLPPVYVCVRPRDVARVVTLSGQGPTPALRRLAHWLARLLLKF